MRPYLALIKDSFRAAIASSVLYVMLAVITVLLIVIIPLHVRESLDWRLGFSGSASDLGKVERLAKRLVEQGGDAEKHPTVARVWDRIDSSLKSRLKKMVKEQAAASSGELSDGAANNNFLRHMGTQSELEDALNDILKERDFYDEQTWSKKRLNTEARDLINEDASSMSDQRVRRRNRLLMASAFPRSINRGGGSALEVWYGPWQYESMTVTMSFTDFSNLTLQYVTGAFDWILSIGLLIAILITANFIPETFLPGSLNLLMSKPISRWGLLLAKFVGGCAFVTLCAVYLFVGVWLWLGIQMGTWAPSILYSIPLYVVVFAIYYSVSTFVGVYSRSPILSIIMTIIFWAACFVVGTAYQFCSANVNSSRTRDLVSVDGEVLHVGSLSTIGVWNPAQHSWDAKSSIEMMEAQKGALELFGATDDEDFKTVGPVYDPKFDVVLTGSRSLTNPAKIREQALKIAKTGEWVFEKVGLVPNGAVKVVSAADGVLLFTRNGDFYRHTGASVVSGDEADKGDKKENEIEKLASLFTGRGKTKDKKKQVQNFKRIGPDERIGINSDDSVAYNASNNSVYVVSNDRLQKFDLLDGLYKLAKTIDYEFGDGALVAAAGQSAVVAMNTGKVQVFNADTLTAGDSYTPQQESPFTQIKSSADGQRFALLCRNKTLWLLEDGKEVVQVGLFGQGEISAASFDEQGQLLFAGRHNRVQRLDLAKSKSVESFSPRISWFGNAFEYVVRPLYWVFPKPGEFGKLVSHLARQPDKNEDDEVDASLDLRNIPETEQPWQPLWSGLAFMCVMLCITGLIFHYRDF